MSHFMTVVLVPKNCDPESETRRLLAPFNENADVPEYDRRCYCIGLEAERDAEASASKQVGDLDTIRAGFHAKNKHAEGDEIDRLWQATIKPFVDAKRTALQGHPLKDKPQADCDECQGSGTHKSTLNPKSKWDYWRFGGRWDGVIQGQPRESEGGFNFGPEHDQIVHNTAPARDLLGQDPPFAIVTPDGEWHERGQMCWFGVVAEAKDDWPVQARALLEKHSDCIAIACDLHI